MNYLMKESQGGKSVNVMRSEQFAPPRTSLVFVFVDDEDRDACEKWWSAEGQSIFDSWKKQQEVGK